MLLLADNFPAYARRGRLADAGAGTAEGDARQHDRRRRRRGRELALLPGVRARARLPDRAVGQALRADAGDSLPRSGDQDAALHRRRHAAQRLPADARRHRHDLHAQPGPHRLRPDGRRRPRIRLRLHPRRARHAATRRHRPVPGLGPVPDALSARTRRNLPNQTFVTFNAGTYRTSHSDLDALGITMYSNGSEVLPTSGLFTYTEEPDLEYFHGTRSHNTVVVDGKDQAEGSAEAGSHGSSAGADLGQRRQQAVRRRHPPPHGRGPAPGARAGPRRTRREASARIQPDVAPGTERHPAAARPRPSPPPRAATRS